MNIHVAHSVKIKSVFFMAVLLVFVCAGTSYAAPEASQGTIVSNIVHSFYSKLASYEQVMLKGAKLLFYWCAVLEVAYLGIKAALGASDIGSSFKNFCLSLLTAGFFLAVIHNYHEWAWNVINGLKAIAGEATTLLDASDKPFTVGLGLAESIFKKCNGWKPLDSLGLILAGMSVLFCFSLISLQIIFIKCECIVAMCASSILLGLGATSFFRDYAINSLRYIFAVAFKLMTMQLVMGVGISFINDLKITDTGIDWMQIGVTICFCVIFYALVRSLPDIVSGIIQGSHVSSGNALSSAVGAVGGATIGGAIGTAVGAHMVGQASRLATMQGKTGMGRVTGTVGNLVSAGMTAMQRRGERQGKTSSMLRSQIMQQKQAAEESAVANRLREDARIRRLFEQGNQD